VGSGAAQNSLVYINNFPADVTFTPLDQYVFSIVQNIVDNVCLHDARVKAVIERHNEMDAAQDEEDP
jgi:hypothetical protein